MKSSDNLANDASAGVEPTVAQANHEDVTPDQMDESATAGSSSRIEAMRRYKGQISALLFSVAITALILSFADRLQDLQAYGYAGVFLISLLGNATVILPVPSLAVVFAGGSVLNPALVGLVSGVAEPLGEMTGYLAGFGGSAVIEDRALYDRLLGFMERRGFLTIFVLAAIPNPLFDLAGITAGATKMKVWKFLLACWLGKSLKAWLIALLGSVALPWFQGVWATVFS